MGRVTLIIADDDSDFRDWLVIVLAPLGAEIHQAATGTQLWRLVATGAPADLVITDVRMPAPDGLEVLARVRGQGSDLPFLVISGFADDAVRAAAARHGAEVLAKPFTGKQLLARVRQLLDRAAPAAPPRPEDEGR
jgi:two-component system response regulator MprA